MKINAEKQYATCVVGPELAKMIVNAFLNASADGIYVQSLYDPTPSTQTRYYNLSGQRLSQRSSRGIIVVVDKGGKARKLLVR